MSTDRLEAEEKAVASYQRAIAAIRECKSLHEAAGLSVPERVLNFLGAPQRSEIVAGNGQRVIVPAPPSPSKPAEARADWLWLPIEKVTPTVLVLAVLRDALGPLTPKEIRERLETLRPVSAGVLANIGGRLAEDAIARTDDGWVLKNKPAAPILHEGNVWGAQSVFDSHDLAIHRRDGIVHVLRLYEDGLQIVQIAKTLEQVDWLHAPVSKDLIKTDMATLEGEGRARRVGGPSGKWRATTT